MTTEKTLPSGQLYEEISEEELQKQWFMYTDGIIKILPEGFMLPKNFLHFAERYYDFNWRPTDILVNTFPKSGTTWTQEIIWNLVNNPDLDNDNALTSLDARFPNFEADIFLSITGALQPEPEGDTVMLFNQLCPDKNIKDGLLVQLAYNLPSPRMLKVHTPLNFFPSDITKRCKVFYVLRDPRDVLCSMYHYSRLQIMWGFRKGLNEFVDQYLNDQVAFSPYWEHVSVAWSRRHDPDFCILYYEDLKEDPFSQIKRIDKFLGTNRTDQQIQNIAEFTSFENMKERTKANPPTSNDGKYFNPEVVKNEGGFFRKGKVGDWKNFFDSEKISRINEWMKKNLESFGEDFKYKV